MRSSPVFANENGSPPPLWLSSMPFCLQSVISSSTCSVRDQLMGRNFMQLGHMFIQIRCPSYIPFLARVPAGIEGCQETRASASALHDGPPLGGHFCHFHLCRIVNALRGGFCKQIVFAVSKIWNCFKALLRIGVVLKNRRAILTFVCFSESLLAEKAPKHQSPCQIRG